MKKVSFSQSNSTQIPSFSLWELTFIISFFILAFLIFPYF